MKRAHIGFACMVTTVLSLRAGGDNDKENSGGNTGGGFFSSLFKPFTAESSIPEQKSSFFEEGKAKGQSSDTAYLDGLKKDLQAKGVDPDVVDKAAGYGYAQGSEAEKKDQPSVVHSVVSSLASFGAGWFIAKNSSSDS